MSTTVVRKGVRDWLLPGLVAGAFGLVGVLAGGRVTLAAQERQSNHEDTVHVRETAAIALGTARIMGVEFASRVDATNAALGGGYPRAKISLATDLSPTDRRVVAAAMTPDQWNAVAFAESQIGRAQRLLPRHPGQPLSAVDRRNAKEYRRIFQAAGASLKAFESDASP